MTEKSTTRIFYRLIHPQGSFSDENFNTFDQALARYKEMGTKKGAHEHDQYWKNMQKDSRIVKVIETEIVMPA
ncbi:hypothetical protein LCGC14_1098110 [marine sediment metagenome]|uniref:Uncharacterized protein n=1 Tax=marine sediment metagenome TaxID=412755 RepID=A0A0F9MES6_9ZZZZ